MRRSFYLLFLISFFLSSSVAVAQISKGGKETGMKEIREPAVAGAFYPDKPEVLSRDVKRYLENAKKEKLEGEIVALVSPHAGYMYSGQVAAYAYKLIEGRVFDSVVVVAPSHRALFKGASIYDRGGYRTPLGVVPIDTDLSKKMMEKRKEIQFLPEAHYQEHSLEVQIPLSEMFSYATVLRSLTEGRGTFTMEFDHYEEVPQNIAKEIIEGKRR